MEHRGHAEYEGANATGWQPNWLSHVWQGMPTSSDGFEPWVDRYLHMNTKLDPTVHKSPLTVRRPLVDEVSRASAVGFKVRCSNISELHRKPKPLPPPPGAH